MNNKDSVNINDQYEGLQKLHSFVHQSNEKVTSLTISIPKGKGRYVILTLSDKVDKLRVKLDMDEIAGLSYAVERNREWKAFHTFEESHSKISYRDGFFSVENGKRITMKLAEDEKAEFVMVLRSLFQRLVFR